MCLKYLRKVKKVRDKFEPLFERYEKMQARVDIQKMATNTIMEENLDRFNLYRGMRYLQGMFTDKDTRMKGSEDLTIENMLYCQLALKPIPVSCSLLPNYCTNETQTALFDNEGGQQRMQFVAVDEEKG